MIKFQVLSDLHLEIPNTLPYLPEIPVLSEVLILAGDIGNLRRPSSNESLRGRSLKKFLGDMSQKFKKVLYVLGNHEFYFGEYHETKKMMRDLCDKYENVELLDNRSVVYNGIKFIGTTLWSYIDENYQTEVLLSEKMSDYKVIKYVENGSTSTLPGPKKLITIDQTRRIFLENMKFLESQILDQPTEEKIVIITHHPPIEDGVIDLRKLGVKYHDLCCSAWINRKERTEHLMKHPSVVAWVFGHTHFNPKNNVLVDEKNKISLVSNQWGYKMKNKLALNFDKNFVFEC